MSREELIEQLTNLQNEIKDYAKYIEVYTYHPYDKVKGFSKKLSKIIEKV